MDIIIVGAGFAGTCAATLLREQLDARVTLLERHEVPGGMLRTLYTKEGLSYEYGPRVVSVFRGTQEIIPFLRRFVNLEERLIYQGTRLRPEYPIIPFPVDHESLRQLPCGEQIERELAEIERAKSPPAEGNLRDYLESTVGATLTALAFDGFNEKFWGLRLEQMPAVWGKLRRLERIAEVGAFRLPSEAPHFYPTGGFNPLFEKMLDGFDVRYNVLVCHIEMEGERPQVVTNAGRISADLVIATAPIDAVFGFGPLEWRGTALRSKPFATRAAPGSASRRTACRFRGCTRPGQKHRSAARPISASSITGITRQIGPTRTLFYARSWMSACACIPFGGKMTASTNTSRRRPAHAG